jgi:hypothetical protein
MSPPGKDSGSASYPGDWRTSRHILLNIVAGLRFGDLTHLLLTTGSVLHYSPQRIKDTGNNGITGPDEACPGVE